ncbi:DoxX family protein [Georgenia muralis]|uniref:Putative membrane protein YphA (DoxX/SURF4 family) n=1 Tax=Georgenia muralis TaxID=154117 RepID=A0A3N4Z3F0_9MICO|nr:DoxX family protein [Georgenia muralis]RPF26186.1 putative membrane protein YphA (DoxX/SURF4 family) [Georgenia muralis]
MDVLVLLGRVLFGLLFVGSGYGHLAQRQMMAAYAAGKGVPAANVMVPLTGLQILVGALMVALGIWPDVGALLLVAFLVPTAFIMHGFWAETDPGAKAMEQTQFLKDLALAGAALVMFAVFAYLGDDLGLVLVSPLFTLS